MHLVVLDERLRAAWHPIRLGKSADSSRIVHNFVRKYSHLIPKCSEVAIEPLTGDGLLKAAASSGNSAGGMDGILPSELKLMSEKAASALACIFNAIEDGAPWPCRECGAICSHCSCRE